MGIHYKIQDKVGIIEFNQEDSKVNLLTAENLRRVDSILDEIKNQGSGIEAVIFLSGKKDVFIAGADIKEIEGIKTSLEAESKSKAGQDIFNKIEDLPFPTVSVIDGVALGGGCELVLSCTYRVATFSEKVRIGLPEVNLGIIPGFGGTYRLPRLIGLTQALKIILGGKVISSQEALKIGLVDRLFPQKGLERFVHSFVEEIKKEKRRQKQFIKKSSGWPGFLDHTKVGQLLVFDQSQKEVLRRTKGFYPAPLKALSVIQKSLNKDREEGLKLEAKAFGELATEDVCKNLIKVFYLSEKYKKFIPPECEGINPKIIQKCGVVGAGVMGGGIAQLLSYYDIPTRLKDINFEAIAKGLQSAYQIYAQAVLKKRLKKSQAELKMGRISTTTDYSGFKNMDSVIEAVVENMDVKKNVFKELSAVVPLEAILCTNTSALSVTELATGTPNPSRVIGFHFFNPVDRMPLLEIIKTPLTSSQTIATTLALAKRLGKTPILVKDSPGFLVNRILLSYINEAGRILEEGATIEYIDQLMTDFGMPMGPLTLADEVGLDVGVKVLHILQSGLGDRFKPVEIFNKVYELGLFGKKLGKGFYIHQGKQRIPNPQIDRLRQRKSRMETLKQEDQDRMVLIMINEASQLLQEQIVDDPSTVDVGMIMGTGFPPFRGGLLRFADQLGIDHIIESLKFLDGKYTADRFQPSPYLLNLQRNKTNFYSDYEKK